MNPCKRVVLLILVCSAAPILNAEPAATAPSIPFDAHDGYFVANTYEPDAAASFAIFREQKEFDKAFGVARVMHDKAHRLPAGAFETKFVAAAVLRGKALVTYKPESVTADAGVLTIRYSTASQPSDSATFACPMILSIPKGNYSAVRFVQDGKIAKEIKMAGGGGATQPAGGESH